MHARDKLRFSVALAREPVPEVRVQPRALRIGRPGEFRLARLAASEVRPRHFDIRKVIRPVLFVPNNPTWRRWQEMRKVVSAPQYKRLHTHRPSTLIEALRHFGAFITGDRRVSVSRDDLTGPNFAKCGWSTATNFIPLHDVDPIRRIREHDLRQRAAKQRRGIRGRG